MYSTSERTKQVFSKVLELDPETLLENAELAADLGIDSLHQVEVIMAIEEEFDIVIENNVADRIISIGDVVKLVDQLAK